MQKEELKEYLNSMIDALEDHEWQQLVTNVPEPDFMTIVNELSALKGEVKKMNTVSLKVMNNIQGIIENTEKHGIEQSNIKEIKSVLLKITDFDELVHRAQKYYSEIPEPGYINLNTYKQKYAIWQEGYNILIEKWKQLFKEAGIKPTGKTGENFNPVFHEAIDTENDSLKPDNIITETQEIGFLYKGNLLKQAKVVVNKIVESVH